ncbi:MAG: peptidylprolyl isomerase [Candidatus Latescibacteria bacterium]|nr:peptidylprolyl isomerase [Candidatus Latescibacterota bacterium]
MKKFAFGFLLLIAVNALFGFQIANRIVAIVGNEIILQSELDEGIDFMKLMTQVTVPDSELVDQVLDELIKNRLLLEQAKKETVDVSRAEVEDEVEKNILLLKQRFESAEQFQAALQNEGMTERILRDRYRADIRNRLISQRLLAKKGLTNINITPTEVQRFYNTFKDSIARRPGQVALAHILLIIKPSSTSETQAQNKITEIYDIILRGGDFEQVAKSFSEDKSTSQKGGYLGSIALELLQPEIQVVVNQLKSNEISPPFRTRNGYEIIKCISRKGERVELAHILVQTRLTRADTLQTQKTAQNIRSLLVKGADFDSLAQIYSDDPMSQDSGGYLGEFVIAGLQEPFRSAIKDLPAGAVSEPVLSEHGYHLIKILVKQEETVLSLEEMQDQIRSYLFDQQLNERLVEYVAKIAMRTYIEKYID